MGKGDKKSKKGKIAIGSFGVSRKRRVSKKIAVVAAVPEELTKTEALPKKAVKKPAAK